MKILAMELSSAVGSLALRDGESLSLVRQFPADRKHSGLFYENLSALRREFGLPDLIVVGLGPGSYAGIRIAIATAIGLRAASGARLVGVPSICAFALPEYCAVGDARRSSYFFSRIKNGRAIEGPSLMTSEELQTKLQDYAHLPILATESLGDFQNITIAYPSAEVLADLGERADATEILEPIYLRAPYITKAKTESWIR